METYQRSGCVVFRKTGEMYGGLSNMAGGYPLVVNDRKILTSEGLYQSLRFPDRPDIQEKILNERSPMSAKMVGKPYREDFCRKDWDEVRVRIMEWCLRVKYSQHRTLFGSLLRSTGDRPIVEESHKVDFWSTRIVEKNNPEILRGENTLGRLLMDLRSEVPVLSKLPMYRVEPLDIENFRLLGEPVRRV